MQIIQDLSEMPWLRAKIHGDVDVSISCADAVQWVFGKSHVLGWYSSLCPVTVFVNSFLQGWVTSEHLWGLGILKKLYIHISPKGMNWSNFVHHRRDRTRAFAGDGNIDRSSEISKAITYLWSLCFREKLRTALGQIPTPFILLALFLIPHHNQSRILYGTLL